LHLALENVSRLAIECIESNRLASYTEKSTRYQKWDPQSYHLAHEVRGTAYEALYRETCDHLFAAYQASLEPVRAVVERAFPRREEESEARWDGRIRSKYVDVCRFLLPAASLANVGMTVNARALEGALRKMLSHPLEEVRRIGRETKEIASAEVPTLLKYVEAKPYLIETRRALSKLAATNAPEPSPMLRLVAYDPEGEIKVLAAALFEHGWGSYLDLLERMRAASPQERQEVAQAILGPRGKFDVPLRALEHTVYTFETQLDQGAYFELKRHRMMTLTPQPLSTHLGYAVPRLMVEAGLEDSYRQAMDRAAEAYRKLERWNPHVAAYLVPNAFNRRAVMTLNLRQAYHFCELRSAPNAHFSIRRVALRMAEMIRDVHPLLASAMRLPAGESWQAVEAEHFAQV
jgi:thymidylate synthase ThyX